MRLTEGIVVDSGLTFGKLRFLHYAEKFGNKMRMERLVMRSKNEPII